MTIHVTELTANKPKFITGGTWCLKSLSDITVIFGKNGSGKSQLLRAIRNTNKSSFHYVSPERAGEINLDLNIMQSEMNPNTRADRRQQNFSQTYRSESVSRIGAIINRFGFAAGKHIEIPTQFSEIETIMQTLLTDFKFEIIKDPPYYKMTRVDEPHDQITSINSLSSGESEILSLALDIITVCVLWEIDKVEQRVLLLDEPDMHLHPELQQHLAHFLVKVTERFHTQILVATHSTTLLSSLGYYGGSKTSVIYMNKATPDQKARAFNYALQEISSCLGGHALMGPLFGMPLLLVEGDDDYQIWSMVPRYGIAHIAVIPCHGSPEVIKYQKALEHIFASMRDDTSNPVGYALLDGDIELPQGQQSQIKFIRLHCLESENLFLTDEVLSTMDTNWEEAKTKIRLEATKYGGKQSILEKCESWDRKQQDLKEVINQISDILDPKKLQWTRRIGSCIGKKKPEGQLADFLGNEVLESLWTIN